MTETQRIAAERITKAMENVETAQRHLDLAGASICSIAGLAPVWDEIVQNYERVKRTWYRLEEKLISGRFDLDSTTRARFAAEQLKGGTRE